MKNKTLVVMCNGESLKKVDIPWVLNHHDVIGMNNAYRYFEKINKWPKYYCCFDYALSECPNHIKAWSRFLVDPSVETERFYLMNKDDLSNEAQRSPKLYKKNGNFDVKPKPKRPTTGGNAVRVGIELGYTKFILLGVDVNYTEHYSNTRPVGVGRIMVLKTPEKHNYFFDEYLKEGDILHKPNGNTWHMPSWDDLSLDAKNLGLEIINCNENSPVKCFPKDDWKRQLGYPS